LASLIVVVQNKLQQNINKAFSAKGTIKDKKEKIYNILSDNEAESDQPLISFKEIWNKSKKK
jgi:hypothetical protein